FPALGARTFGRSSGACSPIFFHPRAALRLGGIALYRRANLRARAAGAPLSTGSSRVLARSIGFDSSRDLRHGFRARPSTLAVSPRERRINPHSQNDSRKLYP